MKVTARREARGEQRDEGRLDQAALVVAFFRPGIGKEDMDAGERRRRDHVAQHFDRVVLNHAQVAQAAFGDLLAQAADARRMDFDAEVIVVGMRLRDLRGGLAHAEADFEDFRRAPAEDRSKASAPGA